MNIAVAFAYLIALAVLGEVSGFFEDDFDGESNQNRMDIQVRRSSCKNLGGRCVKKKKGCPNSLPLETKPGKPYCSKWHRCCYPGSIDLENKIPCKVPCQGGEESSCNEVEFRLYNSLTEDYDILIANDEDSVKSSSLNPSLKLLVVAHGFRENASTTKWVLEIKNKYLEKGPMNVILVQWTKYSKINNYCKAARYARCVGTALAKLLNFLKDFTKLSPSVTHIIGFSLGAQLAGVAGHNIKNTSISRITGLDPAGPGFYNATLNERLDETDADFVDIIHTNGGCVWMGNFGYADPCGDVDFYMNGGSSQNGCKINANTHTITETSSIDGVLPVDSLACSHRRAYEYYVESLTTSEHSYGYLCNNYATFKKGTCLFKERNVVGVLASPKPAGSFYSKTQAESPFLTRSIFIKVKLGGSKVTHGKLFVGAILHNRSLESVNMMSDYYGVTPGEELQKLITTPSGTDLGSMQITARYIRNRVLPPWKFEAVYIKAYDAFAEIWYCISGPISLEYDVVNKFNAIVGEC